MVYITLNTRAKAQRRREGSETEEDGRWRLEVGGRGLGVGGWMEG